MKNLKVLFLAVGLLFIAHIKTSANPIYSGEITYSHVSGLTYRINVTLCMGYSMVNGWSDIPMLDSVHVSEDFMVPFYRDSFADIGPDIRINYYSREFTYYSAGYHHLYLVLPKRPGNVINIQNSFFTLFVVESELIIDTVCPNSSVTFADMPIYYGQHNKIYNQNVAILNPDHDSLSYEFVPSLGENVVQIPGSSYPPGFTIDPVSGEVSSVGFPDSTGLYGFAIKITEWKNQVKVGSVMRDYVAEIRSDTVDNYFFDPPPLLQDTNGNYYLMVNPTDPISMTINYTDSITFPALTSFGEAFFVGNPATVVISAGASEIATANLTWTPDATHSRPYPYAFTFRGDDGYFQTDLTVLVYVNGQAPDSCYSSSSIGIEEFALDKELIIFPNPVSETLTIQSSALMAIGIKIDGIEIFNVPGERLYFETVNCESCIVNCEFLTPGIYFVKVASGGKVFFEKIIKQ